MEKIALVAAGGAGTSFLKEIMKHDIPVDYFCIDSQNPEIDEVIFYNFREINDLSSLLMDYECIVFVVGFGSTGGDAVVQLYKSLPARKIVFGSSPFYFELNRAERSRRQVNEILQEDLGFEGAIISLNNIAHKMESEELEDALKKFDEEFAELILESLNELFGF